MSEEEFNENELLFDELYEKTKDCGRVQFINLLMEKERENQKYKEVIDKSIKCIDYNNRYRNDADIYQFVDIKGEILEPLKDILEQNEENSNIYLKEFNDWLKEVE